LQRKFPTGLRIVEGADLVVVMPSSSSIYPFAAFPGRVKKGLLGFKFIMSWHGGSGGRADDMLLLAGWDEGVRKLVKEQGRTEELEEASGSAGGRDEKAEGGGGEKMPNRHKAWMRKPANGGSGFHESLEYGPRITPPPI